MSAIVHIPPGPVPFTVMCMQCPWTSTDPTEVHADCPRDPDRLEAQIKALADALEALVRATETDRNVGMFIEDARAALRSAGRLP